MHLLLLHFIDFLKSLGNANFERVFPVPVLLGKLVLVGLGLLSALVQVFDKGVSNVRLHAFLSLKIHTIIEGDNLLVVAYDLIQILLLRDFFLQLRVLSLVNASLLNRFLV